MCNNIIMSTSSTESIKLQLEEAVQMLRLVADEQRTCVEVREWLEQNYPTDIDFDNNDNKIVNILMKVNHGYTNDK